ncbi:MAG: PorV/PorQ family protein [Calditrichaeota bacterium]|nr:PorV/PorQ family protein [Calditrichota bacterium]
MTVNIRPIGKKRFVSLVALILFFLCQQSLFAQKVSRVGTSAATFLKIGVGARALAMGEAYTTLAEDVTATYWNPSGLSLMNSKQFLFTHYNYIADLYFDYVAMAIPFRGVGTFGFFITYLGMPDIERTTVTEPYGTGEKVSASSFNMGISYARSLTNKFSIGGSFKYIQENLWHTSAKSFAFDVGLLYRTDFKNIRLGMSITNFGPSMRLQGRDLLVQHDIDESSEGNNGNINADLKTDDFSLPILFRVGISMNIFRDFFNMKNNDLILAMDAIHPNDNYEYMNFGMEYSFKKIIALRAGYRESFLKDREGGLTYGVGLNLRVMGIGLIMDYALADFGRLDTLNKFSLILELK